ncbi:MAG: HAD hydrolase family protein [Polaromonas sp.]|nr:HAD hydrolase family protein [Polaromonas sp.]
MSEAGEHSGTAARGIANLPALAARLQFAPELLLKAQDVRVVFFDVDGVFTDGGLYLSESGETLKRFSTLDGYGLRLLQQVGITPAVITGRDSAALRTRLQALGIAHAHFGCDDKRSAAELTLEKLALDWSAVAAMGDDWPDLPVLRRAVFACAPPAAHPEVCAVADHVTRARAGHGAARELCDLLLVAGGHYARLLEAGAR